MPARCATSGPRRTSIGAARRRSVVNDKPDRDQMLGDYAKAERLFAEMGARPSLARLLRDWGKALRVLGMADEGAEKLRLSLALFEELAIEREANEVERRAGGGLVLVFDVEGCLVVPRRYPGRRA